MSLAYTMIEARELLTWWNIVLVPPYIPPSEPSHHCPMAVSWEKDRVAVLKHHQSVEVRVLCTDYTDRNPSNL